MSVIFKDRSHDYHLEDLPSSFSAGGGALFARQGNLISLNARGETEHNPVCPTALITLDTNTQGNVVNTWIVLDLPSSYTYRPTETADNTEFILEWNTTYEYFRLKPGRYLTHMYTTIFDSSEGKLSLYNHDKQFRVGNIDELLVNQSANYSSMVVGCQHFRCFDALDSWSVQQLSTVGTTSRVLGQADASQSGVYGFIAIQRLGTNGDSRGLSEGS